MRSSGPATRESGLPAKAIKEILEDDLGNFWLGSDAGIIRVSKQELNDLAEGRIAWLHAMTYGEKDGLSNVECRGGSQPAVCETEDGQLWFATHVGVATIDPRARSAGGHRRGAGGWAASKSARLDASL